MSLLATVLAAAAEGETEDKNALIKVTPGLMIWTLIAFALTLKQIDARRQRISDSIDEADNARAEARRLLEEHRALIGQARGEADAILAEARKVAEAQRER